MSAITASETYEGFGTTSMYGCPGSVLDSVAITYCSSQLQSLIPTCGITDVACCSTAYNFMAMEGKCVGAHAPCLDVAAWTNDASSGLSECVSAMATLSQVTGTILQTASAARGGQSQSPSATGTGATPKSTPSSTVAKSTSGGQSQSQSASAGAATASAKNSGGKIEMGLRKSVVVALAGSVVVMLLTGGI